MERPNDDKLEQVVNGFAMEEAIKPLLLAIAREKGATPDDLEGVLRMMATEQLPDHSFNPNPLVDQAIFGASERAIEIYGELQLRILDESFKNEK